MSYFSSVWYLISSYYLTVSTTFPIHIAHLILMTTLWDRQNRDRSSNTESADIVPFRGFYQSSGSGTLPSFSQLALHFCEPFSLCLWLTQLLTSFECQILLSHFASLCINFSTITAFISANCIWLIWCHLYVQCHLQSKYFKFPKTACLKIQLKVSQNWRSPILSNFLVILIRQRGSCGGRKPTQPT